ncbi:MAG: hypothetical protein OEY38_16380 [Gammaproteobacteria bacterium]|nr:hypothetical protein [Gammaproteobacteria bacterium]
MNFELSQSNPFELDVLSISGPVLPGDLIEMLKQLWQQDYYVQLTHVVWDFTHSETHYYFEDIFQLFAFVKQSKNLRGPHTLAVVAPHDNEFGSSRMFAALNESELPKVNIFRELESALDWLNCQKQATLSIN